MRAHSRSCGESVEDEKMRRNTLLSWERAALALLTPREHASLLDRTDDDDGDGDDEDASRGGERARVWFGT